jgi:hypothetical protein
LEFTVALVFAFRLAAARHSPSPFRWRAIPLRHSDGAPFPFAIPMARHSPFRRRHSDGALFLSDNAILMARHFSSGDAILMARHSSSGDAILMARHSSQTTPV